MVRSLLPPVMDHSRVRLVDYKVSMRRSFRADEWDLVTKTLQGRQLQPPLYSFLTSLNLERGTADVGSSPLLSSRRTSVICPPCKRRLPHSQEPIGKPRLVNN